MLETLRLWEVGCSAEDIHQSQNPVNDFERYQS